MNEEKLQKLGLSPSQAKAYLELVIAGKLTPAELMEKTGESRTNAYMVLDKLVELNLAYKDEVDKKLVYRVNNPVGLQKLAERQRERALRAEEKIREAMPEMLKFFHEHRTQPGVRFVQGREGLKQIYQDHLKAGGDAVVFRSTADDAYYGEELDEYQKQRAEQGIYTELIGPYSQGSAEYAKQHDKEFNRTMYFVDAEAYTAPVEIFTYGSKTAITSFGEESIAMQIESPQIADAIRQIFELAKKGARKAGEKK